MWPFCSTPRLICAQYVLGQRDMADIDQFILIQLVAPLASEAPEFIVAILFVLPWLDRSPVRSMRYKGWMSKVMLLLFCISFVILGILGVLPSTTGRTILAQVCTAIYFAFFLLMPLYTKLEKTKPVPERVTG